MREKKKIQLTVRGKHRPRGCEKNDVKLRSQRFAVNTETGQWKLKWISSFHHVRSHLPLSTCTLHVDQLPNLKNDVHVAPWPRQLQPVGLWRDPCHYRLFPIVFRPSKHDGRHTNVLDRVLTKKRLISSSANHRGVRSFPQGAGLRPACFEKRGWSPRAFCLGGGYSDENIENLPIGWPTCKCGEHAMSR
jgi:hypothetical protein